MHAKQVRCVVLLCFAWVNQMLCKYIERWGQTVDTLFTLAIKLNWGERETRRYNKWSDEWSENLPVHTHTYTWMLCRVFLARSHSIRSIFSMVNVLNHSFHMDWTTNVTHNNDQYPFTKTALTPSVRRDVVCTLATVKAIHNATKESERMKKKTHTHTHNIQATTTTHAHCFDKTLHVPSVHQLSI